MNSPKRQCSPCTACCEGWLKAEIEGQKLRPGSPCRYSTGKGCAIYERRPEKPCRTFICGWLAEDSPLPESFRPSECGAIVILNRPWKGFEVTWAVPVGEKIPEDTLDWLINQVRETGIPLLYIERVIENGVVKQTKSMFAGSPSLFETAKLSLDPEDIAQF
jgi:hypothetical protein